MQYGFVQVRSWKVLTVATLAVLGVAQAVAADKVWLDKKALDAEMKEKFGASFKLKVRDDEFAFNSIVATVTEADGLQIRFRCASRRDGGGFQDLFLEFDKAGKLTIAKSAIRYNGKSYTPKAVNLSTLKLPTNESRVSLIDKMADALQANIKSTPIIQKGRVRTPNWSAAARYLTVMVAKNVWFGPKVTDHRTGSGGRTDDRRGDGN